MEPAPNRAVFGLLFELRILAASYAKKPGLSLAERARHAKKSSKAIFRSP